MKYEKKLRDATQGYEDEIKKCRREIKVLTEKESKEGAEAKQVCKSNLDL